MDFLYDMWYTLPRDTVGAVKQEFVVENQEPILQFFAYGHLPGHLQVVSQPFGNLAEHIVKMLPRNPERTVALRKLLEAKDAAVRAHLFK
jgi:hypothetical protein